MFSVEYYPPKDKEEKQNTLDTTEQLKKIDLNFVSITERSVCTLLENNLRYGKLLQDCFGFTLIPHITCLNYSRNDLDCLLLSFKKNGFSSGIILRGDSYNKISQNIFSKACDFVYFIQQRILKFCMIVSGYPEKHYEALYIKKDLKALLYKVEVGAYILVTQIFWKNKAYNSYLNICRAFGIKIPIISGILPTVKNIIIFCYICHVKLTQKLIVKIKTVSNRPEIERHIVLEWSRKQCEYLHNIHFYLLNCTLTTEIIV